MFAALAGWPPGSVQPQWHRGACECRGAEGLEGWQVVSHLLDTARVA